MKTIIELARDAGMRLDKHNGGFVNQSEIIRFAALVREAERGDAMKSIQDLARGVGLLPHFSRDSVELLQRFHDAAIAQYRESLLAGVGEAADYQYVFEHVQKEPFYTADQIAGAVARERERIAKMVEEYETEHDITATWLNIVAAAIRGQR